MRAQVGCTAEGKLLALEVTMYSNGGNSLDLSASIMDRALLHIDCVYRIPNVRAVGHICRTNHASNTAFRGFGGPQVPGPYPVVTLTDNSLPSSNPAPHTAFYTVQLPTLRKSVIPPIICQAELDTVYGTAVPKTRYVNVLS